MHSILIVDDLESIHEMLDAVVQPIGYSTAFATDGETALQKYREHNYDIVLTDINMQPMNGLGLLKEIRKIDPKAIVIMMSGFANVSNAMESLKLGAFDYLTKPFKVEQLIAAINKASAVKTESANLSNVEGPNAMNSLVGESEDIKRLRQAIAKLANSPTPILIQGEKGVQKSLISSILHNMSDHADAPFVVTNCNQLSTHEIREKLIGHKNEGGHLLDDAKGGTLFLKEVDLIDLDLQKEVSDLVRRAKNSCRIICSSSHDLESLVDDGKFDDSLFYRIATVPLRVSSLRERSSDIPDNIRAVLEKLNCEEVTFDKQAISLLQGYNWPGNYTELKETIEAIASSRSSNEITIEDLPEKFQDISAWPTLDEFLAERSEEYIKRVLQACHGDEAKAAEILKCEPARFAGIS